MATSYKVTKEESNQKIFNYLQRKFILGMSENHKWIRSGQVRINGKRCQAYDRIIENDEIRVPPFAQLKIEQEAIRSDNKSNNKIQSNQKPAIKLDIIYEDDELLVINKAQGIAVQGGSKQEISIADELKKIYINSSFMPTPAHRLDKDTSGVLLIAKSYNMLQRLHEEFKDKEDSSLEKYYLALVCGNYQTKTEHKWEDYLYIKKDEKGREKTCVLERKNQSEKTQYALSKVKYIDAKRVQGKECSLLEIQLITGRKHQIRVQCAHRNIPILGDLKYGGMKADRLYLHAHKVIFDNKEFIAEIPW